eukprot:m.49298 g.49298  ORF g.49298 m.49298 type:complete len:54 (+) comp33972_c0_seq13:1357-1518(+)
MVHVEVPCSDEKWDCESVLSTYSNLYNHPTKIKEPSSLHVVDFSIYVFVSPGL